MEREERELQFRKYIELCKRNPNDPEIVGQGNPYAKILLVGQESAMQGDSRIIITRNIDYSVECLNKGDFSGMYYSPRFYENRQDKNGNNILNRTWCAYQKLIDYIRPPENRCNYSNKTDFCKDAFTTELNNTVSPHHARDWKPRINTFKQSDYIKGFPVVILACSNYIQNIEGNRQIDDTFGVTFDDPDGERIIGGMKYYIHHSRDRKRLVIHTRQLSQYSNELLFSMAATIREHFIKIGESYEAICY